MKSVLHTIHEEWYGGRESNRHYVAAIRILAWIAPAEQGDELTPPSGPSVDQWAIDDCRIRLFIESEQGPIRWPLNAIEEQCVRDAAIEMVARRFDDADAAEKLKADIIAEWQAECESAREAR